MRKRKTALTRSSSCFLLKPLVGARHDEKRKILLTQVVVKIPRKTLNQFFFSLEKGAFERDPSENKSALFTHADAVLSLSGFLLSLFLSHQKNKKQNGVRRRRIRRRRRVREQQRPAIAVRASAGVAFWWWWEFRRIRCQSREWKWRFV